MRQLTINPNNRQYYSEDFIKGFNCGAHRQFEADKSDADRPQGEWIESFKRVETRRGAYLGTKFVHDGWSCSECSEVVEKRYPNCPYCLARMKGASDDIR